MSSPAGILVLDSEVPPFAPYRNGGASAMAERERADARRNRERLLAAAAAAFAAHDEPVSLEEVARAAGVGIGTLYRHFPTRQALIEAVYRAELAEVSAC